MPPKSESDIFAPLTESERSKLSEADLFAPLSDDERKTLGNSAQASPSISGEEAAVRGAVQGFPFIGSYADEAAGLVESAFTDKPYDQARDESRAQYEAAKKQRPAEYYSGLVGTSIVGDIPKAVPLLGQAYGAAEGAIYGLGESEADLTQGEYADAAKDVGISAGLGAVMPKVMSTAVKGGSKVLKAGGNIVDTVLDSSPKLARGVEVIKDVLTPPNTKSLKSFAEKRAFKSIEPSLKLQQKAEAMGRVNSIGRELLDNKIVTVFDSVEDMIPKLKAAGLSKDQALGAVREIVEASGAKADMRPVMYDLLWEGLDSRGKGTGAEAVGEALKKEADSLAYTPNRGINEIVELKGNLGEQAKYNGTPFATPSTIAADKSYGKVRDLEDDLVRQVAPDKLDEYILNRELSSHYKQATQIAEAAASRNSKNSTASLTDKMQFAAQAASGDLAGVARGVTAAVANKGLRERGNATVAVGADKLANFLERDPFAFGKFSNVLRAAAQRGNTGLAATHYLLQQRDPEYRETVQRAMNNEETP